MRRRVFVAVVCVALISAGCGADTGTVAPSAGSPPGSTHSPTPHSASPTPRSGSSTPSPGTTVRSPVAPASSESLVTVAGGSLPVDAATILRRVYTLHGATVERPVTVQILSPETIADRLPPRPQFLRRLGVQTQTTDPAPPTGYVRDRQVVYVSETILDSPAETERVLVHEFAHTLQQRERWDEAVADELDSDVYDESLTIRFLIEGHAVVTERRYAERYEVEWTSPWDRRYRQGGPMERFGAGLYALGADYVQQTVTLQNASAVFTDPPADTTTLLRRIDGRSTETARSDSSTPPSGRQLLETVTVGTNGSRWQRQNSTRVGVYVLRQALSTELNATRSLRATTGWETDVLAAYSNDTAVGYVLAVRWRDREHADRFERAARDALAGPGDHNARVLRPTPRATVLLLGPESFRQRVTISTRTGAAHSPSSRILAAATPTSEVATLPAASNSVGS